MASNRNQIQEETRMRVLRLLHENSDLSTRDIAHAVGISNGSAFYCINALVEKGLVKLGNFKASKHKNRYAYMLTPKGVVEKTTLTRHFLQRKMAEYDSLKEEIETLKNEVDQIDASGEPGRQQ